MTGMPNFWRISPTRAGAFIAVKLEKIGHRMGHGVGDIFIARIHQQRHQTQAAPQALRKRTRGIRASHGAGICGWKTRPAKSAPARAAASAASALFIPQILTSVAMFDQKTGGGPYRRVIP